MTSLLTSLRHQLEQLSQTREKSAAKFYDGLKTDVIIYLSQNGTVSLEESVHPNGGGSLCHEELGPGASNKGTLHLGPFGNIPHSQ